MFRKSEEKCKVLNDHHKFLSRIAKTFYYGKTSSTSGLSFPITEITSHLFTNAYKENSLGKLHFEDAATISRLIRVSPCSLVLALLYIDRLKIRNPKYFERITPPQLFLVSLVVSSKFLHDDGEEDEVYMDEWAVAGGMSIKELIQLEKDFLRAIEWEIYFNNFLFWEKIDELEMRVAKKEGLQRGWFTYTELNIFLKYNELLNLAQCVASFSVILVATYTAGVLVVLGSMWFVSQIPGNCLRNKSVLGENQQTYTNPDVHINYHFDCIVDSPDTLFENKTVVLHETKKCNNNNLSKEYDYESNKSSHCIINIINNGESWNRWINLKEWFSKTYELTSFFDIILRSNVFFDNSFFVYFITQTKIDFKKQIHEATKQFLKEQVKSLWIKEWIASNKKGMYKKESFCSCIQEVVL